MMSRVIPSGQTSARVHLSALYLRFGLGSRFPPNNRNNSFSIATRTAQERGRFRDHGDPQGMEQVLDETSFQVNRDRYWIGGVIGN
jgi:xanthine dehydrogenase molybdopterin-binding subunit B